MKIKNVPVKDWAHFHRKKKILSDNVMLSKIMQDASHSNMASTVAGNLILVSIIVGVLNYPYA